MCPSWGQWSLAERAFRSHLKCIVQDDFCGHLVNARFHNSQYSRPESQKSQAERERLQRRVAPGTTLCLWAPRSQPLGPLAVTLPRESVKNDRPM